MKIQLVAICLEDYFDHPKVGVEHRFSVPISSTTTFDELKAEMQVLDHLDHIEDLDLTAYLDAVNQWFVGVKVPMNSAVDDQIEDCVEEFETQISAVRAFFIIHGN